MNTMTVNEFKDNIVKGDTVATKWIDIPKREFSNEQDFLNYAYKTYLEVYNLCLSVEGHEINEEPVSKNYFEEEYYMKKDEMTEQEKSKSFLRLQVEFEDKYLGDPDRTPELVPVYIESRTMDSYQYMNEEEQEQASKDWLTRGIKDLDNYDKEKFINEIKQDAIKKIEKEQSILAEQRDKLINPILELCEQKIGSFISEENIKDIKEELQNFGDFWMWKAGPFDFKERLYGDSRQEVFKEYLDLRKANERLETQKEYVQNFYTSVKKYFVDEKSTLEMEAIRSRASEEYFKNSDIEKVYENSIDEIKDANKVIDDELNVLKNEILIEISNNSKELIKDKLNNELEKSFNEKLLSLEITENLKRSEKGQVLLKEYNSLRKDERLLDSIKTNLEREQKELLPTNHELMIYDKYDNKKVKDIINKYQEKDRER